MTTEKLCFRQDVIVEPLYDQWYAWSYLISPATAAMYIADSHLKKMQSFVSAPQMHVAALKNPAMLGGPFIDHDPLAEPLGTLKSDVSGTVNATIERLDRRGVLVRRVSGAIELRFAEAINADVVASDIDGDLLLDLPDVSRQSTPVRTMLRARVGTGGWPISTTKVSGNVRLVRAG